MYLTEISLCIACTWIFFPKTWISALTKSVLHCKIITDLIVNTVKHQAFFFGGGSGGGSILTQENWF